MSDGYCDVSIGSYDGDEASFYSAEIVKRSRKAHVCDECKRQIEPGEPYERIVGKWEDKIDTWRFCAECREVSVEFSDGARCFGVLWDEMRQNWHDGAHLQACLNRLTTVKAKEHMRQQWMKWKGLA